LELIIYITVLSYNSDIICAKEREKKEEGKERKRERKRKKSYAFLGKAAIFFDNYS
jgi:hypothetical protein